MHVTLYSKYAGVYRGIRKTRISLQNAQKTTLLRMITIIWLWSTVATFKVVHFGTNQYLVYDYTDLKLFI